MSWGRVLSSRMEEIQRELRRLMSRAGWRLRFRPVVEARYQKSRLRYDAGTRTTLFLIPLAVFGLAPLYGELMFETPDDLRQFMRVFEFGLIVPACLTVIATDLLPAWRRWSDTVTLMAIVVLCISFMFIRRAAVVADFAFPAAGIGLMLGATFALGRLHFFHILPAALLIAAAGMWNEYQIVGTRAESQFGVVTGLLFGIVGGAAGYTTERLSRLSWLRYQLIRDMAARDGLTGLSNRRAFEQTFERALRQAAREGKRVAVMLFDLDCFKLLNDHHGHLHGDHVLQAVAGTIAPISRRPMDITARYGGEEFAVLWYDIAPAHAQRLGEALIESIAAMKLPNARSTVQPTVTASGGLVHLLPRVEDESKDILAQADTRLYEAKGAGRNRLCVGAYAPKAA